MTIEATSSVNVHGGERSTGTLCVWECGVAVLAEGRAITAAAAVDFLRRDLSRSGPYEIEVLAENLIAVRHATIGGQPSYWHGTPHLDPHAAISALEEDLCGHLTDVRRAALSEVLRALVDGTDPAGGLGRLLSVPAQKRWAL